MRRWNGWGDEADDTHVGATPRRFLEQALGPAAGPRDATLAEVVARVPAVPPGPCRQASLTPIPSSASAAPAASPSRT